MTRGSNSAAGASATVLQRWLQVLAWEHARAAHGARGPSPHEPGVDDDGRLAAALGTLAAVADLEDALAAAKASAVAAAGEAGAFHGDVAAALRVSRQAVSTRWWHYLASHPGRPAVGGRRVARVDDVARDRRRTEHLDAVAGLRAALDDGRDRRRSAPPAPAALPSRPVEDRLF